MIKILSFTLGALSIILFSYLAIHNTNTAPEINVSDMLETINIERQKLNIEELSPDESLMQAAQIKAEDIAKRKYFSNMDPDNKSTWELVNENNYKYFIIGENLILTDLDSKDIIMSQLNMGSVNRDNLLNKSFDDVGIGLARYGKYKNENDLYIVVGLFANKQNNSGNENIQKTIPAEEIVLVKDSIFTKYAFLLAVILSLLSMILFIRHRFSSS